MIQATLDKTLAQSTQLRKKTAPSGFLSLSREVELIYRKPLPMTSSASALTLKERLYELPFSGYLTKLVISFIKLPVRFKQIYETLDNLMARHDKLQDQLREAEQRILAQSTQAREFHQDLAVLKELNHKFYVQTEKFQSENLESFQRSQETVAALENRLNRLQISAAPNTVGAGPAYPISDAFYAAFERRFRSSSESLQSHLENYLSYLNLPGAGRRAVDLGCGRGEWLKILQAAGFAAEGVDINSVTNSHVDGIHVQESDALTFLADQPTSSIDVLSSFHLIEHVDPGYLIAMVQQAKRALKPGGILILETPNPENLVVGACNFYMDATHKRPIPPSALDFIISYAGLESIDCRRFQPGMPESKGSDATLNQIAHFFSVGQDYAIIARKPKDAKDPT